LTLGKMAFILSCSDCLCRAAWYSEWRSSSFRCFLLQRKQRKHFTLVNQRMLKFSLYGSFLLKRVPWRTAASCFVARLEEDKEKQETNEANKEESGEESRNTHSFDKLSSEDKATLEEIDRLAEEWIGQDLSRWYTYRKFQALRDKLLKQEEEEELDTQRDYEELYANLLIFGKMIGFPLVNEETGKINLYGYLVMTFFLLLPLVVLWYIGQAISSGVDWIIQHQSPF